jgi:hypothetical protein
VIAADAFYVPAEGPPKQGDILLAGVARMVAEDRFTPPQWARLDAYDITVPAPGGGHPDLRLTAGPALVMVTSHDCHFDKEWNRRRSQLIKKGVPPAEAERSASEDTSLDRAFTACPLLRPEELDVDRGNLVAGKLLGYLPVPASADGLVPEAVVDLTYRVTLDRLDVVRVGSISAAARAQLRYALTRLDSLRAVTVGFEIEAVVGKHIETVSFPASNPLLVRLGLDDGSTIELLQQPADPDEGPARAAPPGGRRTGG